MASEGIRFRNDAGGLASIGEQRAAPVRIRPFDLRPTPGQGGHVFESGRRPPNPALTRLVSGSPSTGLFARRLPLLGAAAKFSEPFP